MRLGPLRDRRALPRTRMVLVRQRTQLKNRIHATLAKYALQCRDVTDLFGGRGLLMLRERLEDLPPHSAYATRKLLQQVEALEQEVDKFEQEMHTVFRPTREVALLMTVPGIGFTLAVVIAVEIGDVGRFPTPEKLAAYAGTTPRVHSTGGKTRYGPLRPDVNRYLKWAFIEAANVVCRIHHRHPDCHTSRLYERIARRKGHHKAIGAVARHLAEASYWLLTRQEPYRDPTGRRRSVSSTEAQARNASEPIEALEK
jgi:transposase